MRGHYFPIETPTKDKLFSFDQLLVSLHLIPKYLAGLFTETFYWCDALPFVMTNDIFNILLIDNTKQTLYFDHLLVNLSTHVYNMSFSSPKLGYVDHWELQPLEIYVFYLLQLLPICNRNISRTIRITFEMIYSAIYAQDRRCPISLVI